MVHTNMAKNHRQPYSVSVKAGKQVSALSWGTGRAVARVPRVNGGGTHRAGQAAYGNMCRGGHMFAPTKTWRRWHRKVNLKNKRYAVCSALAASAVPSLVLARGHRIERLEEVPVVVSDDLESISKTKDAMKVLEALGALPDVKKARDRRHHCRCRRRRRRHSCLPLTRAPLSMTIILTQLASSTVVAAQRPDDGR